MARTALNWFWLDLCLGGGYSAKSSAGSTVVLPCCYCSGTTYINLKFSPFGSPCFATFKYDYVRNAFCGLANSVPQHLSEGDQKAHHQRVQLQLLHSRKREVPKGTTQYILHQCASYSYIILLLLVTIYVDPIYIKYIFLAPVAFLQSYSICCYGQITQ